MLCAVLTTLYEIIKYIIFHSTTHNNASYMKLRRRKYILLLVSKIVNILSTFIILNHILSRENSILQIPKERLHYSSGYKKQMTKIR